MQEVERRAISLNRAIRVFSEMNDGDMRSALEITKDIVTAAEGFDAFLRNVSDGSADALPPGWNPADVPVTKDGAE